MFATSAVLLTTRTDTGFGAVFVLVLLMVWAWDRYRMGSNREPVQFQLAVNPWLLIGWLVFCLLVGTFFVFTDVHFKHPAAVGVAIPLLLCVIGLFLARLRV